MEVTDQLCIPAALPPG